ncbi:putative ribonuclease H-like domain-containing protein [Tanacetum coccineum]
MTLIEAARTMLADSFLPNTFWAEAVSTACYVLNRVLVTKPQNKTPYELITGKIPIISYIRPFGCHVTILNTIDHWHVLMGNHGDEGFLVGSENQANKHAGPQEANQNAGTEDIIDAGDFEKEAESAQDYFVLPIWSSYTSTVKNSKAGVAKASNTNIVNTASTPVSTASPYGGLSFTDLTNPDQNDSKIHALEEIYANPTDGIIINSSYDDEGAVADFTNLEPVVNVSPIPTSRINSIHPSTLILRDPQSAVQTRSKVTKSSGAHAFKISEALEDKSWVDAMQEELLQFKIQKVWILIDLPYGKKAIGTKWVYRNKKDERGLMVKIRARLLAPRLRPKKPLVKIEEASDVVTPKTSHLSAVKRIFRYLKGKPKLGLWYPRVSSFDLEAYSDSDYAGANLDRKSTTGGCQFLDRDYLLAIKKQTIVATSTTEAEYVAAANCCGQVLWIQNQMLDYGFNFMNTKIYIDNESTICIVKNLVYHSKTKHIAYYGHLFVRVASVKENY